MAEIRRLPTSKADRKVAFERKAHRAALNIGKAPDKKQAVKTLLHYLNLSI